MTVRLCLGNPSTGERCNVRVVDGSYCPHHAKQREAAKSRARRGDPRWTSAWQKARAEALKRQGRRCQVCGRTTGRLQVHHLNGDVTDHRQANLSVRCNLHHPGRGRPPRERKPWPPRPPR